MSGHSTRPDFIFYLGLLYLLYLAPPLVSLWNAAPGPTTLAVVAGVLVVFVATYVWLMRTILIGGGTGRADGAWLAAGIGTLSVLAAGLVLAFGTPWLGLFIYASVAAGFAFSVWPAVGTVGAIAVASAGIGLASGSGWTDVGTMASLTAAIGIGMVGTARVIAVNRELGTAGSSWRVWLLRRSACGSRATSTISWATACR
jgi:two-component system, NarL family, sensor histidine kinase DesK